MTDEQRIKELERRVKNLERVLYLYSGGVSQPEYKPIEFETQFQGLVVLVQSALNLAGNAIDVGAGAAAGYTRIRVANTEYKIQILNL